MKRIATRLCAVLAICWSSSLSAQSLPPHPRLLFRSQDIPELQARALTPGTRASAAYSSMVTSVSVSTPSDPLDWSFMRNLRRMQEVAFRHVITGSATNGTSAKTALMNACNAMTPNGSNGPYQMISHACAVANTFDMIYPLLSASERQIVVGELEDWIDAIRVGTNAVGSYNSYAGCTDNYSFAWSAGIVTILLAIEGDTSYPNRAVLLQQNLDRLRSGWRDPVSPDGSIDENYGYANYGVLWSVYAGIAAANCGYPDPLAETNVLRTPRWFAASLLGSEFPWTGDSSPSHKGLRIDPILYYLIGRTNDAEAFFGVERIFASLPIADAQVTMAFSPFLCQVLHYPLGLVPQQPAVLSSFFRDNRNEGAPAGNKTINFFEVGDGGQAFLHNSADPAQAGLSAFYIIRDEWMNHSHEDDGHLGLALGGQTILSDRGYGSTADAQSGAQNIVEVSGLTGFAGSSNNYFTPPTPNGRFLGRREASLFSRTFDYVRGTHTNMWMMEKAGRTAILIKDAQAPYMVLLDNVKKDAASRTYDQLFHSTAVATGAGTAANPMRIAKNGRTLESVYLSPSSVTVTPGTSVSASGMTYFRNRVRASGVEVTFASILGADGPSSTLPLSAPLAGTVGGTGIWPTRSDKILAGSSGTSLGDADTASDGRFAWIRSTSAGALSEWVAAEATTLIHEGQTLLTLSARSIVAVRAGRVDISTDVAAAALEGAIFAPFAVSAVEVNGEAISFVQSGAQVLIGAAVTSYPISTDDRVYTFRQGQLWDGVAGSNLSVTSDGRITSTSGWANFIGRGNAYVGPRPIALAVDVEFALGSPGESAAIKLDAVGSGDALTLMLSSTGTTNGGFRVDVRDDFGASTSVGLFDVPFAPGSQRSGRVLAEFDPGSGVVALFDPLGQLLGLATVSPVVLPFRARFQVNAGCFLDNATIFDSAEDGIVPCGLVFWALPNGESGFAGHAPGLLSFGDLRLTVDGQLLDSYLTFLWYQISSFGEIGATPYAAGAGVPLDLREAIYESASVSVAPNAPYILGMSVENLTGQRMTTVVSQL